MGDDPGSDGVIRECAAITRGTGSTVDARYRQLDAVSLDTLG